MNKLFDDINGCSEQLNSFLDNWRSYAEGVHGDGVSFVYQCLIVSLTYTLGFDHLRHRPREFERLNKMTDQVGGFAQLPIPREVVLMTALTPAMAFIDTQAFVSRGGTDPNEGVMLHACIRAAARLVRLMMPHVELHQEVQAYLDLTDEDIARLSMNARLQSMDTKGHA